MKRLFIIFISLIFTLLLFNAASAITPKKHILENGLTLIHIERHELPIVMLTILVKAGSRNEPEKLAGLAYFTGNMLTEGTEKYTSQFISEEMDYLGASIDVEVNHDYSLIKLSILKKDIEKGLDIFMDVLRSPVFPEKEINRKREIIISSILKSLEDPLTIALRELRKEIFRTHPYGRPVEGYPETLRNIQRKDIIKFYSENYRPDNAIAVMAGDISESELKKMVNKYFIEWKPKGADGNPGTTDKPTTEGAKEDRKRFIFIEKELTQSSIVVGVAGLPRNDKNYYSLTVMNYILGGGGFASRLMQRIREKEGLAYDASSYHIPGIDHGIFIIQVQTRNESRERVLEIIKEEMERIKTHGITDEELMEAKSYLKGSFKRRLDTTRKIADFLSITEFFGLGDDYIIKYDEYIDSISKDDVRRIAKRLFNNDIFTVIVGKR